MDFFVEMVLPKASLREARPDKKNRDLLTMTILFVLHNISY